MCRNMIYFAKVVFCLKKKKQTTTLSFLSISGEVAAEITFGKTYRKELFLIIAHRGNANC